MAAVLAPAHSSSVSKSHAGIVVRIISLIAIAVSTTTSCTTRISPDAGGHVFATVTKVVDGDTVHISINGTKEEIRLIGVDTPETVHPTKSVQCFGPEASEHTKQLLPRGTRVYVVRDIESRDRYGRLLAYLYRAADNLFINNDLVLNGWARPYPYPPNTTLETTFSESAHHAETHRLGLWSRC